MIIFFSRRSAVNFDLLQTEPNFWDDVADSFEVIAAQNSYSSLAGTGFHPCIWGISLSASVVPSPSLLQRDENPVDTGVSLVTHPPPFNLELNARDIFMSCLLFLDLDLGSSIITVD